MPYIFAFTLLLNIVTLGYFIFKHEKVSAQSPYVEEVQNNIPIKISVSKAD